MCQLEELLARRAWDEVAKYCRRYGRPDVAEAVMPDAPRSKLFTILENDGELWEEWKSARRCFTCEDDVVPTGVRIIMKKEERVFDARQRFGQFFLDLFGNDYRKTCEFIQSLWLEDVTLEGDALKVTLARPGMLIGRRGETIQKCQEFMGMVVKIIESRHHLLCDIVPVEPLDWDDFG